MQTKIFEQCQQELKPGTILYRSWGYDQTNVNFYVVVRTTKTMVIFQSIQKETVGKDGDYYVLVAPVLCDGKPVIRGTETLRRKVQTYEGRPFLSWANYANAGTLSIWSGAAKSETACGFGH